MTTRHSHICPDCNQPVKRNHSKTCVRSIERREADQAIERKLNLQLQVQNNALLEGFSGMPRLESTAQRNQRLAEGTSHGGAQGIERDDNTFLRMETRAEVRRKETEASAPSMATSKSTGSLDMRMETRTKVPKSRARRTETKDMAPAVSSLDPPSAQPRVPFSPIQPGTPKKDDIRTTYHPSSARASKVSSFEDYGQNDSSPRRSHHPKPWLPFRSKSEFSFAEIVHKAGMSQEQINSLVDVVQTMLKDREEHFLVKNYKDISQLWDKATAKHVPFHCADLNVQYGGYAQTVQFWSRSLKDWAATVLDDSYLGKIAEFDATKLEKFDGDKWVRFIHEPWTADRMWNIQSKLPANGRPLLIAIYADKTRLSSFGTAMGHPIMARIDNFPDAVRTGTGLGSTEVVGWLPIIQDDEAEKNKPDYVNFKKAIYHGCFKFLFSTIADDSHFGGLYKCADELLLLFPSIYVAAVDFEEQTAITLTRGVKALYPCTVCLCPRDELSNLDKEHPLRTAEGSKKIWIEAQSLTTKAAREKLFKAQSLRNVENAFWDLANSDPHQAVTFDKLHVNDHGLGGKHAYPEARRLVENLPGRSGADKIGKQYFRLIFFSRSSLTQLLGLLPFHLGEVWFTSTRASCHSTMLMGTNFATS